MIRIRDFVVFYNFYGILWSVSAIRLVTLSVVLHKILQITFDKMITIDFYHKMSNDFLRFCYHS